MYRFGGAYTSRNDPTAVAGRTYDGCAGAAGRRSQSLADELLAYRDRFPTLRRGPYFAAHTLGPMPDTVPAALARFAEEWATQRMVA